jgi:uncharacterized membrane protein
MAAEPTNEEEQCMRTARSRRTLRYVALGLVMLIAGTLAPSEAGATVWKVCNSTAEVIDVAIVYSMNDAGHYISKGWWRVPACGGCKVVYSGDLPIKGTFLRGESEKGAVWEGENLFCTSQSRFEIANANVSEKTCKARGQDMKAFQMHTIKNDNFTTTLRDSRPGARHCID